VKMRIGQEELEPLLDNRIPRRTIKKKLHFKNIFLKCNFFFS
jgi:hypothetical protein